MFLPLKIHPSQYSSPSLSIPLNIHPSQSPFPSTFFLFKIHSPQYSSPSIFIPSIFIILNKSSFSIFILLNIHSNQYSSSSILILTKIHTHPPQYSFRLISILLNVRYCISFTNIITREYLQYVHFLQVQPPNYPFF